MEIPYFMLDFIDVITLDMTCVFMVVERARVNGTSKTAIFPFCI